MLFFGNVFSATETFSHLLQDFNAKAESNTSAEEKGGEGISRIPSDEHICLSPPWNEEEEEELLVSHEGLNPAM